MQQVLKNIETQPITIGSLRQALPKSAKVILYDSLPEYGSIEGVFGRKKSLVILYQLHDEGGRKTEGMGHYSTILKLGNGKYEFFSSYGFSPEQEINKTHSGGKLIKLLGKNVVRSSVRLQQRFNSNTCGRWAAARCILRDVPLQIFLKHFAQRLTLQEPDDIITLATLFLFRH